MGSFIIYYLQRFSTDKKYCLVHGDRTEKLTETASQLPRQVNQQTFGSLFKLLHVERIVL